MNKRQAKTLARRIAYGLLESALSAGFEPETGDDADDDRVLAAMDELAQDLFNAASRSPDQPVDLPHMPQAAA